MDEKRRKSDKEWMQDEEALPGDTSFEINLFVKGKLELDQKVKE